MIQPDWLDQDLSRLRHDIAVSGTIARFGLVEPNGSAGLFSGESTMYECETDGHRMLAELKSGRDPALSHRGTNDRLPHVHAMHVALAASGVREGVPPIRPFLLPRLANAATMMSAAQAILRRGPRAPGLNGLRLEHLSKNELWSLCRALAAALRDGIYRPGEDRTVHIPKMTPGKFRKLTIQNVEDRIVAKALMLILQPILERKFSPFSFGFRPGRGAQSALATALSFAIAEGRWVWVCADVARAFDQIPHPRLLDACRKYFPPEIVQIISIISYTGDKHGVRQGSPASPLVMNLFYDHFLDWRWSAKFPAAPLFRYADDLMIACRTFDEAIVSYAALEPRMTGIGTPLKGSRDESIRDLNAGQSVDWLGFRICLDKGQPTIRIGDRAWRRLGMRLASAHLRPAPPIRAIEVVRGWLTYLAPCYAYEDRTNALDRLHQVAAQYAFDEIPSNQELAQSWSAAHARWHLFYEREQQTLPHRLNLIRQPQPT